MQPHSPDEADYRFLTTPDASVEVRLAEGQEGHEIELFGNRAGLLSLANVLFWLVANASRREFLSLTELSFIHAGSHLSLCLRLIGEEGTGRDGLLLRTDCGEQWEWAISEDDLQRVALLIHRLVSMPGHEYDRLKPADGSAAGVHIRMTDVVAWLQKGNA